MPWLPQNFNQAGLVAKGTKFGSYFQMSATHRGDMYHIRAALTASANIGKPRCVLLYDCTKDLTEQLEDYLVQAVEQINIAKKIQTHIVRVSWGFDQLKDETAKPTRGLCLLNRSEEVKAEDLVFLTKLGYNTEGGATSLFCKALLQPNSGLPLDMAMVGDKAQVTALYQDFQKVQAVSAPDFATPVFEAKAAKTKAVLVLHRDSGQQGGPYPELDTGKALKDILAVIDKQPSFQGVKLVPVVCGRVAQKDVSPWHSTGEYWKRLKPLVKKYSLPDRSVDTAFLWWAYNTMGFFDMVIGFRSGALDLFTFMGIPTVSIGLRNMVGETRHELLANPMYKRINVQYNFPRHNATGWVIDHASTATTRPETHLLHSPWWKDSAPTAVQPRQVPASEAGKVALMAQEPAGFSGFDIWTFEVGLRLAAERYLTIGDPLIEICTNGSSLVTSRIAKLWVAFGLDDTFETMIPTLIKAETADLYAITARRVELQAVEAELAAWKSEMTKEWEVFDGQDSDVLDGAVLAVFKSFL